MKKRSLSTKTFIKTPRRSVRKSTARKTVKKKIIQGESLSIYLVKLVLCVSLIVDIGALAGSIGYLLTHPKLVMAEPVAEVPAENVLIGIELSGDKRSVLDAVSKQVVFNIDDVKKYLEGSEVAMEGKIKYSGECFEEASLANSRQEVAFVTGCVPKSISSQPWVGIYDITPNPESSSNCVYDNCVVFPEIKFLTGGAAGNLSWSSDDKAISFETYSGKAGITRSVTADPNMGRILRKNADGTADTKL